MTTMTETTLGEFNGRVEQLNKIYQANPERFVNERGAVTRAEAALESAKQAAAATIARREQYTALIEAAHQAGALSDSERAKILDRHKITYRTPNVEDAQRTLDATWESFWNILKHVERQALRDPQPAA